jgi:polar amino acid transport system permease protein
MKGVPAYVQILVAYFVIPHLLGITVSGFFAASLALDLCSSGYVTEIIRSQIDALPQGQWDACYALGYPLPSMIQHIILPQALKNALPALLGELEQLLKSTSLLATIGVTELTRAGMNIVSRELNPLPVYLMLASIYLLLSAFLTILSWYFTKGDGYARRS